MKKHWTDGEYVNRGFVANLKEGCPHQITNKEAYQIYHDHHSKRKVGITIAIESATRTQLAKMEHVGILERIARGVYRWIA